MKVFIFLIAHFIGDFILQSPRLAEAKKTTRKYQLIHSGIYTSVMFLALLLFGNVLAIILFTIFTFCSHYFIDYYRIQFDETNKTVKMQFLSFAIGQVCHIFMLLFFCVWTGKDFNIIGEQVQAIYYFIFPKIDLLFFIKCMFGFIFILSPTSVIIKHTFHCLFPNQQESLCDDTDNRVGSLIGKLERVVIVLLGMMSLYGSIAIVLTAKSLARFRQLENRNFAEKYLVGTLLSLVSACICLLLIK